MTDKKDFTFSNAYVMNRNTLTGIIERNIKDLAVELKETDDVAKTISNLIQIQKLGALRKFLKNWHQDEISIHHWENEVGRVFGIDSLSKIIHTNIQ